MATAMAYSCGVVVATEADLDALPDGTGVLIEGPRGLMVAEKHAGGWRLLAGRLSLARCTKATVLWPPRLPSSRAEPQGGAS